MTQQNKSEIHVGLIGVGNVGRGVARYFHEGRGEPYNVKLSKVAVSDLKKSREFDLPGITDKAEEIINDPNIHIVVEVIGGTDKAKDFVFQALENGKSVVTANKALMARYAKDVFDKAREKSIDVGFEASVGGGIQIISTLRRLQGERIEKIMGILNGTTNYILTQMEEGMDFDEALKIAQKEGFAEANHILDTGGFDTRDKLALLASLIFNTHVDPETIQCNGITGITQVDIDFAKKYEVEEGGRGYTIKLLGIANQNNGKVELSVRPVLLSLDHQLASIRNQFNAVYIEGEWAGPQMFTGKGAGTDPTASAVISDILRIARNIQNGTTDDLPTLDAKVDFVNPDEVKHKGYIRANLRHMPGSLAEVASILSRHGLNISDSVQRKRFESNVKGETFMPDIITVEAASGKVIDTALKELKDSQRIHGDPFFLSFEE